MTIPNYYKNINDSKSEEIIAYLKDVYGKKKLDENYLINTDNKIKYVTNEEYFTKTYGKRKDGEKLIDWIRRGKKEKQVEVNVLAKECLIKHLSPHISIIRLYDIVDALHDDLREIYQ